MKNVLDVKQIIYGASTEGYCILASSDQASNYHDEVIKFFEAVNVPDDLDESEVIVANKYCAYYSIYLCISRGARDQYGRGTLFAHAIIVMNKDVRECFLDAIDLYDNGFFLSHKDNYANLKSEIDISKIKTRNGDSSDVLESLTFPFVVIAQNAKEGLEFFRKKPTYSIREKSWSSFTSRFNKDLFDFACGGYPSSHNNFGYDVYDIELKKIKEAIVEDKQMSDTNHSNQPKVKIMKNSNRFKLCFVASLLLNFVLFLLIGLNSNINPLDSNNEEIIKRDEKIKTLEEEIKELKSKDCIEYNLSGVAKIDDFDSILKGRLKKLWEEKGFEEEKESLRKLKSNSDFVRDNFFKK